ncbi:tail fiber assembly protein [Yersinia kristensenii]|uniref:tail fiber assembly protein n=1 Tax=Yersinia kristensenii TaxID=28152 RepID=UPI0005E306D6|nr:tail fiber assembly protein [Yersinia kristensenii]MDA5471952.1 tail fiber assembly protein [Yersinia kristensenii]MDA5475222.1 tail fiber assembly protein [Yersinia kristensenii]MDA5504984.1 tail fiber assembly protein [Yersinia kristensenii]MDA5521225.1 tail fiber assembly protein [Yersinia kristensenii]MDR4897975.1 tail fiber assembly protein [Yersinia kristensenii]
MTKYSLDISKAKLGENGLAVQAGWIAVYSASRETREYIGVNNEYIALGVSLPADGYSDAPTLPGEDDKAVRRNVAGTAWEIVPDLRGKIAYDIKTGYSDTVTAIGELPDTLTLLAPQTVYDEWSGRKWVTDKVAQQAAAISTAETTKAELLNEATARIAPLQDTVDTELATGDDKEQLTAWKIYRVLLSRIDLSTAPDINWPVAPQL